MAYIFDEVWVNNGQLVVGANNINPPDALGKGAGNNKTDFFCFTSKNIFPS